jgi:hypothetical protein
LRVPRRDVDARGQVPAFDDFEEVEVAEHEGVEAVA